MLIAQVEENERLLDKVEQLQFQLDRLRLETSQGPVPPNRPVPAGPGQGSADPRRRSPQSGPSQGREFGSNRAFTPAQGFDSPATNRAPASGPHRPDQARPPFAAKAGSPPTGPGSLPAKSGSSPAGSSHQPLPTPMSDPRPNPGANAFNQPRQTSESDPHGCGSPARAGDWRQT